MPPPLSDPRDTLPFHDIRALEDIHELIVVEPVQPQDKVMVGLLATIGLERGEPFRPQGRMKAALERGVKDACFHMQQLDARLFASRLHWPDRHWGFVMVPDEKQGFEFVTEDTVYLAPTADRTGQPLEPGRPSGTDPSCCRTCSGSGRER